MVNQFLGSLFEFKNVTYYGDIEFNESEETCYYVGLAISIFLIPFCYIGTNKKI